jgi:hypothetical protein
MFCAINQHTPGFPELVSTEENGRPVSFERTHCSICHAWLADSNPIFLDDPNAYSLVTRESFQPSA